MFAGAAGRCRLAAVCRGHSDNFKEFGRTSASDVFASGQLYEKQNLMWNERSRAVLLDSLKWEWRNWAKISELKEGHVRDHPVHEIQELNKIVITVWFLGGFYA